jgi:sugar/nucleoside kinase (ribokinase family)
VKPELVLLGNLVVDDVVLMGGTTRMSEPGGAMLYGSLGAALWGTPVGVVSPLGDDYPARALHALEHRGVDLSGLRPMGRGGLRSWLLYEPVARRIIHRLDSATHVEGSPTPADAACHLATARAFHVAPTPLACQRPLVERLATRGDALLSLDPHETVREDNLEEWRAVLAHVDVFFVSAEEMLLKGAEADPTRALARLAGGRLRWALLKRGAQGGVWLEVATGRTGQWPARAVAAVDTTGAGDAFAGGVLSGLLAGERMERAIGRGVVSASFAVETWGAAGLVGATAAEARRRRTEWFGGEG